MYKRQLVGSHVYVLGDGVGMQAAGQAMRFVAGGHDAGLPAVLHAADSAVILLSGATPEAVDAAMALAGRGGLAAGQSAEGCFDPRAAQALVACGGGSGSPMELAQMLARHWTR